MKGEMIVNPGKKHFEIMILTVILIALLMLILGAGAKETPKIAYITFDDGPTLNTPNIIKTLNKYNAYATFFCSGRKNKNVSRIHS